MSESETLTGYSRNNTFMQMSALYGCDFIRHFNIAYMLHGIVVRVMMLMYVVEYWVM